MKTETPNPIEPLAIEKPWTFADVNKRIPVEWFNAEVCVSEGDMFDRAFAVQRISFHTNRTGRRIVVLAATPKQTTRPA